MMHRSQNLGKKAASLHLHPFLIVLLSNPTSAFLLISICREYEIKFEVSHMQINVLSVKVSTLAITESLTIEKQL